jgi:GTP-binding protein
MASAREAQAAADAADAAAPSVLRPADGRLESFTVERDGELFVVRGVQIERLFAKADLDNEDAVAYLQQLIERAGLNDALRKAGATPGDTVLVGAQEFEFS